MATAAAQTLPNENIPQATDPRSAKAAEPKAKAEAAPTPKKANRAKIVLPVLVALAVAAGGISYVTSAGRESTDDAQVEGHVGNVASRVSGQVMKVLVKDNQPVKAGDVLLELDDRDYRVKQLSAKADLEASKAQLRMMETQLAITSRSIDSNLAVARGGLAQAAAVAGTSQAGIDQAKADIISAESRKSLAQQEFDRTQKLFADGAISKAEFDRQKANLDQQTAQLTQSQARLASAQAGVSNSAGTFESARGRLIAAQTGPEQIEAAKAQVALAQARVDQAAAALQQAEYNLEYTKVKAEMDGVVARRTVEVGQLVSPERPLMALVPLEDTWVVANFKEDQLAEMKPGQSVKVKIDTFSGRTITGHVDSLAAGTGSRFSLLPPDNASGNFTKVVQRVPVLVKLDAHPDLVLRPGMSANVTVYTK